MEATLKKAANVEQKLRDKGLKSATELYHKGVTETLTYLDDYSGAAEPPVRRSESH